MKSTDAASTDKSNDASSDKGSNVNRPYDEESEGSSSQPTQPSVMLATTERSPDRNKTLLDDETPTPETMKGPSKDETDLEDGKELFYIKKKESDDNDNSSRNSDHVRRRQRLLLIGFAFSLVFAAASGVVYSVMRRKDDSQLETTQFSGMDAIPTITPWIPAERTDSPSLGPTSTESPTSSPSISSAPTMTMAPSAAPSGSPTVTTSPSSSPSSTPSSKPTGSPSGAPTLDYLMMLEEFLTGKHNVDASNTINGLAIFWMAQSAAEMGTPNQLDEKTAQLFALVTLDLSLQGAKSFTDSPHNARLEVDKCEWKGIRCDANGLVTKVLWDYQPKGRHGSGRISPQVRLLNRSLKVLDLSNNELVGTIPESLYKLTKLEKLYLFKNELEGTISPKIADLNAITHYHLSHNKLTGRIPEEIQSDADFIRPLEYFNVYSNALTGSLPNNMRLRSMRYFDVGRNQLTGTLPDDLGEKFVSLRHLFLDHNRFRGTLPSSYNTVGNGRLESFSINHNLLHGTIPGPRKMYNKLVQYTMQANLFDSMGSEICRMEIPQGEMTELRADCNICRCTGFFNICDIQCRGFELRKTV